jgi:WXG100 family type VII secretion target
MSTASFDVTPSGLRSSATEITGYLTGFTSAYQNICNATGELNVSFAGRASDAFNQKIEGYKPDFDRARTTIDEYCQYLNTYANDLDRAEGELAGNASRLRGSARG